MGYDRDTTETDDLPAFDNWLVNRRPVEVLGGQHRVAALKRLVSKPALTSKNSIGLAIFTIVVCHKRRRIGCGVSVVTDETAQMRFHPN